MHKHKSNAQGSFTANHKRHCYNLTSHVNPFHKPIRIYMGLILAVTLWYMISAFLSCYEWDRVKYCMHKLYDSPYHLWRAQSTSFSSSVRRGVGGGGFVQNSSPSSLTHYILWIVVQMCTERVISSIWHVSVLSTYLLITHFHTIPTGTKG